MFFEHFPIDQFLTGKTLNNNIFGFYIYKKVQNNIKPNNAHYNAIIYWFNVSSMHPRVRDNQYCFTLFLVGFIFLFLLLNTLNTLC